MYHCNILFNTRVHIFGQLNVSTSVIDNKSLVNRAGERCNFYTY